MQLGHHKAWKRHHRGSGRAYDTAETLREVKELMLAYQAKGATITFVLSSCRLCGQLGHHKARHGHRRGSGRTYDTAKTLSKVKELKMPYSIKINFAAKLFSMKKTLLFLSLRAAGSPQSTARAPQGVREVIRHS